MDKKRFSIKMILCGLVVFALYGIVFWGLVANVFETLFIVPLLACGWAISMLVMLVKNWKPLWASLNTETVVSGAEGNSFEEEPKDSFWVLHTIAVIFFAIYYIGVIGIDLITR